MALNGLNCAYVPLRNYSLTHCIVSVASFECCLLYLVRNESVLTHSVYVPTFAHLCVCVLVSGSGVLWTSPPSSQSSTYDNMSEGTIHINSLSALSMHFILF